MWPYQSFTTSAAQPFAFVSAAGFADAGAAASRPLSVSSTTNAAKATRRLVAGEDGFIGGRGGGAERGGLGRLPAGLGAEGRAGETNLMGGGRPNPPGHPAH